MKDWWFLDGNKGSLITADLEKKQNLIRFAESENIVMSNVKPAIADYGFFYVEREIET